MDQAQLNWITNFIWGIADDTLRDVFVRGKYRDVILPMTVLRRLDAVLEPTKQAVLEMKAALDREQITNQDDALRSASGQAFYNTSPFLLRDLKSRKTQQTLKDDFMAYLDGFSPNVQDILKNFEFRNQIPPALRVRRPRPAHREIPRQGHQPQPPRRGRAAWSRQSQHGHRLRRPRAHVQ